MKIPEGLFKAYDIRGTGVSIELSEAVGRALAQWLKTPGPIAVGYDIRADSSDLAKALAKGASEAGREVWGIGLVTTDMVSFAVGHFDLAGGAMITASHNPGSDNGIKLFGQGASPVGIESGLQEIKQMIERGELKTLPGGSAIQKSITGEWVKFLLSEVGEIKPMKVAIDAGNGSAGSVWPAVLEQLPIKAERMFFEPDGSFPNHPANPILPENIKALVAKVKSGGFDLGLAFDADGDRMVAVDEKGDALSGNAMTSMLAADAHKRHPGSAIVYNYPAGKIVRETIEQNGGKPVVSRTGHSFIKEEMRRTKAVFAGEDSGHYYFEEYFYADSGSLAALRLLEIISSSGKKLSELAKPYRKYFYSGELNLEVSDKEGAVNLVASHTKDGEQNHEDGLTVEYPDWRFNLRASNTEPLLRLNIEADSRHLLDRKTQELLDLLKA